MNIRTIIIFTFISLFLISCNFNSKELTLSEDLSLITNQIVTRGEQSTKKIRFNDLAPSFFKNFTDSKESSVLSITDAETFLAPLLKKINLHNYENVPDFKYYSGKILFKSDDIVALTFNCQGKNELKEISAFYIASYSLEDYSPIDCKIINSFSEFDLSQTVGHSYNEIQTYAIDEGNISEYALKINCNSKKRYYNFNNNNAEKIGSTDLNYLIALDYDGHFIIK
jgi:hypothetical protein